MRLSRTHVLVAEGTGLTAGTTIPRPANWVDWASMYDELVWTLSVSGATGSPTSWSLSARFQYMQQHAGTQYRFQVHRWYDLSALNVSADIAEGVGWYGPGQQAPNNGGAGVIATQATSLSSPLVLKRTMRNIPAGARMVFDLTVVGGTNPVVNVGLEVRGTGR